MSLPESCQEHLFAAGNELPDLLPEDDPMIVFIRVIYPSFSDQEFQSCYSNNGRPAISPAFLACVTLLQFREHLSDSEAAAAVVRRLDWKIALHLPIYENTFFDPSTLCYFRKRLKENGQMRLILDRTIEIAQTMGLIRKHTNQRVDATHVISQVNRLSTTDLLFRTVRCVVEQLEKRTPEVFADHVPEYLKERYMNRFSSFGMSKEKRQERMAEIVEDGRLLQELIREYLSGRVSEFKQLDIMETVFAENVVITEKSLADKSVIEIEEIQRPRQTISDPRDPSIRYGRKGKCSWVGSKCHVVETAVSGKINFITNMIHQQANIHDIAAHEEIRLSNKRLQLCPQKLFADTGYLSAKQLKLCHDEGVELMGYLHASSSPRDKSFLPDAFEIDFENRTATCPAGHSSIRWQDKENEKVHVQFDGQTCRACQYFYKCVRATKKREIKRVLRLGAYYPYLKERRNMQNTEAFRIAMHVRAQVEGTISEATRFHGLRYARYRGKEGRQLQFYLTGAAINMKRLTRAIREKEK